MKSPFTGGKTILQKETRTVVFRNEPVEIPFQYYLCVDSGEQFTDDKLDETNINEVYNQYKKKYGISALGETKPIHA